MFSPYVFQNSYESTPNHGNWRGATQRCAASRGATGGDVNLAVREAASIFFTFGKDMKIATAVDVTSYAQLRENSMHNHRASFP
jgi:hypothetical protein